MTASLPHDAQAPPPSRPSTHTVLYDPDGQLGAALPLDREPYESLIKAVLAWTCPDTLAIRDYHQIALQLTGHARAVAAELRHHADQLPKSSGPRALADLVLSEAQDQLSLLPEGTMNCVQARARTVRALYERLDRLDAALRGDNQHT
ncbi:restriction endonuclease [Streptomyces sp. NPDC008125]|uniref:restriction endonuclease n=1 Tax=Streptomyces sp. NPDC008125 TaxID=3364811 RepID=UPI0036E90398